VVTPAGRGRLPTPPFRRWRQARGYAARPHGVHEESLPGRGCVTGTGRRGPIHLTCRSPPTRRATSSPCRARADDHHAQRARWTVGSGHHDRFRRAPTRQL
jgi:hypothetical protein